MTEERGLELAHAAAMPAPQGGALPTGLEWQALERMADTLANSDVIPYRLKRKPADVAVILLAAREYGIPPLMALSKLPVVNGTPAPMGELMVALILRAGHYIAADFRNPDGTIYGGGPLTREHYGEARYKRAGWDEREVLRFTIAEAIQAGLVTLNRDGTPNARDDKNRPTPWEQYTPNMARWRAVANAARLNFADVLLGLSYLPEELGAVVDEDGAPIVGEVVRPGPPTGTIEQRTAQDAATKLTEQPWPDVTLEQVRKHAADNGCLDAEVSYAGERMTLDEAITRHIEERTPVDEVDAELVEEPATETPSATEEEPVDAVTVEDPPEGAEKAATAPPAAQEQPAKASGQETPQDAAYDVAREALNTRDADLLRTMYRGSADLIGLDVLAVVGDDDLAALDAPQDLGELALGTLLMRVADYVKRHGAAVRDLGEPLPAQAEGPDPWAADAAAGWPNRPLP